MGPSDSLVSFGPSSGPPLLSAYPEADAGFAAELSRKRRLGLTCTCVRWRAPRAGMDHRLPVVPDSTQGEMRVSQVPGSSSSRAPRPPTSPDARRARPLSCGVPWPSRAPTRWASGIITISRLDRRGSQRRVPTHRPQRYRRNRKAHFRLAGLCPGRSGFAPAGRQTRFPRLPLPPSFETSLAWSHGGPV